jgi:hypothetical protein
MRSLPRLCAPVMMAADQSLFLLDGISGDPSLSPDESVLRLSRGRRA